MWPVLDRVLSGLAAAAGAVLCVLPLLIVVDVTGRRLGWFTLPWTLDVAEYALLLIAFLGAPWVLRHGGHIAIDLLIERLSPVARRRAQHAGELLGASVCAVLLYYSSRVWWVSFSEKIQIHETFVFPEWILLSVAPPTFAALLLVFIGQLRGRWQRDPRRSQAI